MLDHENDYASSTFAAITYEEVSTHIFTGTSAGAEQPLPASVKYTAHTNFTSQTAGPVLTMLVGDALVKTFDEDASVTMRLHPLPTTLLETAFLVAYAEDVVVTFTALSIPFIAGFFASNIAREKSSKAKYQQMLSGIGLSSYWIGNLLWDFISWWPYMSLVLLLTWAHEENAILIANLDCVFVLLLLYGFSGVCFIYLISQFLETPEGALLTSFAMTLFSGLIFGIAGIGACVSQYSNQNICHSTDLYSPDNTDPFSPTHTYTHTHSTTAAGEPRHYQRGVLVGVALSLPPLPSLLLSGGAT